MGVSLDSRADAIHLLDPDIRFVSRDVAPMHLKEALQISAGA